MLNLLVLIIVMATVAYYASLVVEFILMALNFQRKLGSQKLSIIIIVAIYLAVLGPLVYDGINISFYNLGAVECEGSSQEDESDSSSKVPPCDSSNSLSSSLQKGASALQQALRNDYIAPVTAITVAAGAVKVLSTVPKNSRAGVAVSLVTSLGGVSVAAQGLATLREANCTKKSPVLEEVKKLEKSPSWVADSPNEGMESLFSSAPGLDLTPY